MRKLFLARISSPTDPSIESFNLVVVDVKKNQSEFEQMELARQSAFIWYKDRYPMNDANIFIERTIDGTIDETEPGPLDMPQRFDLIDVFKELKRGRRAADQVYLDKLIKELETN